MASMQEVGMMIDAAVRAALAAARADAGGPALREPRASLDERHFRRCDKLSGTNWKEFSFQFKTAVGSASPKIRDVLEQVARSGKDNDWDLFFDLLPEWTDEEARKCGQEVYAALAALVTGDAMTVVRSVTNGNGWEAWSRLHNRFDPRTPAKALMMMMAVLQTRKAKDSRELPNMVQDWEVKVKNLDVEHGITLDPKIKIALMTSFLPADLQDLVFQWSSKESGTKSCPSPLTGRRWRSRPRWRLTESRPACTTRRAGITVRTSGRTSERTLVSTTWARSATGAEAWAITPVSAAPR